VVNKFTLAPLTTNGEIVAPAAIGAIFVFQLGLITAGVATFAGDQTRRRQVSLLVASLLFSMTMVECAIRLYKFGLGGLSPRRMRSFTELGESGLVQESRDPELIYELKPNLNTLYKLVDFRTNSRGLRDVEYSLN
jgi:hypothetical protein